MTEQQPTSLPGLPPVQPPSGQMILRLFLVPLLIVAVLVGLYLLGQTFFGQSGRGRSAEQFLKNLDSANPDIRWRAASDLSNELPRSPQLASDAPFALELTQRVQAALDESEKPEKDFAARQEGMTDGEREKALNKELLPRRNLIMYLGACLGNFYVPVGVPVLKRLALQAEGMEPDALAERRGRALLALAVLGENLKKYDALPDEDKDRIDEALAASAESEGLAKLARQARDYLNQRRRGKADSFGVADALRQCADDEDPYLRELTAFASNFWAGTAKEQAAIEEYLVRLSMDDGRGEEKLAERQARNPDAKRSRPVAKRRGFQVQANANLALARRGSAQTRLDLLAEMLDPEALREVFVLREVARGGEGREQPNEHLVVWTVTGSLRALTELRKQRPELKLDRVREKVEALTGDRNAALSSEAKKALGTL